MATATKLTARKVVEALGSLLEDGSEEVHLSNIVRHDGPGIQIPEDMELDDAINILQRKRDEENETRSISSTIPAFPYDGAHALAIAMEEMFGYVVSARCGLCNRNHNENMKLAVDAKGTTVDVPWGAFHVPGIDGTVSTGYARDGKRFIFRIQAEVKGKHVAKVNELIERTKEVVRTRSIYKGKAISVKFTDDEGQTLSIPDIKFVDVSEATEPIFSLALEDKLRHDVLSYVTHSERVRPLNGGTLKRGVLLAGPYGTGKTLTAAWIARKATENGFTFIYVEKPSEYYLAHLLARAYQPAILFAEDVESIAGHGRTTEVNQLLNVLDGADSKRFDIITVFTTNHGPDISKAMFRPGRIDIVMVVDAPDAEAAVRLAAHYAGGLIVEGEDFSQAGERLANKIPATIKEAVARARIRAVTRDGDPNARINNNDLVFAAESIENERHAFDAPTEGATEAFGKRVATVVFEESSRLMNETTGASSNHRTPALPGSRR